MKTTLLKSKSLKIRFILFVSFTTMLLLLNITGCALSRQFIRTNTGHGYSPSFTNTTTSNEWGFLEQSGSVDDWIFNDNDNSIQDSDCLVEISTGDIPEAGNDIRNIDIRPYPTHLYPRGIYTTGTGIVIVVDLYR